MTLGILVNAWERRLAYLGSEVELRQEKIVVKGKLLGISDQGHLRLLLADGEEKVFESGSTSLRPVVGDIPPG